MTRLRPHLLTLTSAPLILLSFTRQPTLSCLKAVSITVFYKWAFDFPLSHLINTERINIRCVVKLKTTTTEAFNLWREAYGEKNALYTPRMFERPKRLAKRMVWLTTKDHRVTMKTLVCVWRRDLRLGNNVIRGTVMWTQKRWGKL